MKKILIIYASRFGQTEKICFYIQEQLLMKKLACDVVNIIALDETVNLIDYTHILLASSIYYGKHNKALLTWIDKYHDRFLNKIVGFISVNLTARKPNRDRVDTNIYTKKLMIESPYQFDIVDVFAGKLNYRQYNLLDRYMLRFVMWITKGETNFDTNKEYTDWGRIDGFIEKWLSLT